MADNDTERETTRENEEIEVREATFCGRMRNAFSQVTLEPVIFFSVFAMGLCMVLQTNLIIERVCQIDLNLPDAICSNLDAHHEHQIEVQKKTNVITSANSILSSVPGLIVCLFVGPWSDTHGRKPLLIMPILGSTVMDVYLMIYAWIPSLGGWWSLGTTIYAFLGGGYVVFFTGAFAYITDVTGARERTKRVAFIDFGMYSGAPLGIITGGFLFRVIGYIGVFGLAAAIRALCLVYLIFRVKETVGRGVDCDSNSTVERHSLFHWSHVAKVFEAVFKQRPNNGRNVVIALNCVMMLALTAINSTQIGFLYTRLKFDWTEVQYSEWIAAGATATAFGSVTILPLLVKFGFRDTSLGMIGLTCAVVSSLVFAFAQTWQYLFIVGTFAMLTGFVTIVVRAMISKVGDAHETGSIFAMLSFLESAVPLASAPLLAFVYNSTLESFPGSVYLVLAALNALNLGVMCYIRYLKRDNNEQSYRPLEEDLGRPGTAEA